MRPVLALGAPMTVPVQIPVNSSTANGATTVFPYNFKILAAADLRVLDNGLARTLGVHYTVDGVGNPNGGNITFLSAPADGNTVSRRRLMAFERVTNYTNLGDLLAGTLNADQDAPVMMIQQLAATAMQLIEDGAGGFIWDAQGHRLVNLGDGVNATDAANLGQILNLIESSQGGGGVGVSPLSWDWEGDGVETDMPIPGADVDDAIFYDTAIELVAASGEKFVAEPNVDFTVIIGTDPDDSVMRFVEPIAGGARGFSTLRGYARPYTGATPLTTTKMTTVAITADTTVDGSYHNSILLVDSPTDVTITLRKNTGSAADWETGEFFAIKQVGAGKVDVVLEGVGTLTVPANFLAETRGLGSTIAAYCDAAGSDAWTLSNDLLRQAATPDLQCFAIEDRSVLIGTNIATGAGKASFFMPYGMVLNSVADGGIFASLAVAQATGSVLTVDVNRNGTSILSTKLTFDNNERTTKSAATPPVFDTGGTILYAGDEITIDVDQVGTANAKGLTVYLVGARAS